jgi:hypothetical protein
MPSRLFLIEFSQAMLSHCGQSDPLDCAAAGFKRISFVLFLPLKPLMMEL